MSSIRNVKHFILTVGPGTLNLSPAIEIVPRRIYEVSGKIPELNFPRTEKPAFIPVLSLHLKNKGLKEDILSFAVSLK